MGGANMPGAILVFKGESGALAKSTTKLDISSKHPKIKKRKMKQPEFATTKVLKDGIDSLSPAAAFDAQTHGLIQLHTLSRHLSVPHPPRTGKNCRSKTDHDDTAQQLEPVGDTRAATDRLLDIPHGGSGDLRNKMSEV